MIPNTLTLHSSPGFSQDRRFNVNGRIQMAIWPLSASLLSSSEALGVAWTGRVLMAREAPIIRLSDAEEQHLRRLAHAASTPQAFGFRARLILSCAVRPSVPRND